MSEFADQVKAWREALGWTQEKAAEYLDVPVATYRNWEWGRRAPSHIGPVKRLMELAKPRP